jgi:fatty acid desaturase
MREPEHLVEDLELVLAKPSINDKIEFLRKNAPPELLQKSTVSALIQYALIDWAIIIICWIAITLTPFWLYPLWAMIIAGRLHAFGVILHDATHMPLRGKSVGIRIVEILTGYSIATTLNAMRYHHLRHHRNNGMQDDPYFKPSLQGKSKGYFFLLWLRYIVLMPLWTIRAPYGLIAAVVPSMRKSYAKIFLQDRSDQNLINSSEVITCARAEFGQVMFQVMVLILLSIYPHEVLYGYLIPLLITGYLAGYRVISEHNYMPAIDRSMNTILETTNDHNLGLLGKMILSPRNIGYHIVHHLHPQVGLKYLPLLRDWYKTIYPNYYPKAKYLGFKPFGQT